MKSKRGSNKIYYYIDLFFILLPIILLLGLFVYNCILFKNQNLTPLTSHDNPLSQFEQFISFSNNTLQQTMQSIVAYISNTIDLFIDMNENSIFSQLILALFDFLDGLGLPYELGSIAGFIYYYFTYLVLYEIFSLLINIIMWLPRWARNKVRDWNGSDSV